MPKHSMDILTESMFYVLMALRTGPKCGIDIAAYIQERSGDRLRIGPATLYTILGKFEQEKLIRETEVEGRKRTYAITEKGKEVYLEEIERLKRCLQDASYDM